MKANRYQAEEYARSLVHDKAIKKMLIAAFMDGQENVEIKSIGWIIEIRSKVTGDEFDEWGVHSTSKVYDYKTIDNAIASLRRAFLTSDKIGNLVYEFRKREVYVRTGDE